MMSLLGFGLRLMLCFQLAMSQFETGMKEDRRVVVQLFEWPFDDIKYECKNVLGPQKFGAVLVPSVAENLAVRVNINGRLVRPWWERYQIVSWTISSRLGNEEQFKQMVEECNKNDVRVYVDAVFNHGVGNKFSGEVTGAAGTRANVDTRTYPGLGYTQENFHTSCVMNWNDRTSVRICELADLQDVNQTQPYVQNKIVTFLNKLIDFGVAGFRIDAAKHMWPEDLRKIYDQLKDISLDDGKTRMRPLWVLENFDEAGDYQEDYKDIGSEYDFAFQNLVTKAIKSGNVNMSSLYDYVKNPIYTSKTRQDFGTNHDLQRWHWQKGFWESPNHSEVQQVINAFHLTFSREVPNIFSGYSYAASERDAGPPSDQADNIISPRNCTDGWMCEHRFKPLQWVIKHFTNVIQDAPVESWWSDWSGGSPQQAAFTRGKKGFAVFNADTKALHHIFKIPLPAGVYCDLATGFYCPHQQTCMGKGGLKRRVEVKRDGTVEVTLPGIARSESLVQGEAEPSEPPYLVISVASMLPSKEDQANDFWGNMDVVSWTAMGVALVTALVLISWILRRQFGSRKEIDIME